MQEKHSTKHWAQSRPSNMASASSLGSHGCSWLLRCSHFWAPRCETERSFSPEGKQMSHSLHFPIPESWRWQLVGGRRQSEGGGSYPPRVPSLLCRLSGEFSLPAKHCLPQAQGNWAYLEVGARTYGHGAEKTLLSRRSRSSREDWRGSETAVT